MDTGYQYEFNGEHFPPYTLQDKYNVNDYTLPHVQLASKSDKLMSLNIVVLELSDIFSRIIKKSNIYYCNTIFTVILGILRN